MRQYKFLLKPAFYIVSVFTACWMVLVIEKISPSHLGKYQSMFVNEQDKPRNIPTPAAVAHPSPESLKKLCFDFKHGLIDSASFSRRVDSVFGQAGAAHTGLSAKH